MINSVIIAFVSSLAIPIIIQIIKKYAKVFESNKWVARIVAVLIAAAVAAVADIKPDGKIVFETWWAIFGTNVLGIEFSYQWIIKTLESMTKKSA
ncbi:MAG: hypothetical protein BWY74_03880 [Firmicutes bacterium ADurb.Bin419]|nr:MAG: hypothetical protein BWY74_03880 [Firmicutes bacterium ADurb.Bin419]